MTTARPPVTSVIATVIRSKSDVVPCLQHTWLSFVQSPVATCIAVDLQAVKLTAWLERKIKQALQKNMVFPACTDIKMSFLMDHSDLLTDNLLPLDIPPPHSTKADALDKSSKEEKGSDGACDKPQDRSKSVTGSFGASSIAAPAEQPCTSAPAAIPYPDDVDVGKVLATGEQDQLSPTQAAGPTSSRAPSDLHSADQGQPPTDKPSSVSSLSPQPA